VAESQLLVVQALLSSHVTAVPPQEPLAQTSFPVHASLSLHGAVLFVCEQAPVNGLQSSSVQTLLSLQSFAVPPSHTPLPSQVSGAIVHRLSSLQVVPWSRS
jgi:hypothetical protein